MSAPAGLDSWREEQRSAYLYRIMAVHEPLPSLQALFAALAGEAEKQSLIWLPPGTVAPMYAPDWRTRFVGQLLRLLGPRSLRPVLAAMKVRGLSAYSTFATAPAPAHAMPHDISEVGKRHRGLGGLGEHGSGGNLRAAVFGVSDGLLSNASLIWGLTGAAAGDAPVLLAGLAGLLAGAFSMAAGEYVSVRSQRDLYEYQIGLEREELEQYPQEEAAELALIYKAKGLSYERAVELARAIISNPAIALDTLAREELGLNPDDLGSPQGAALSSFLSFAVGAAIPLAPQALLPSAWRGLGTIAVTAVALAAIGAFLSLFSGQSAWRGGGRMLGIGAAAGIATFFIGKLLGAALS